MSHPTQPASPGNVPARLIAVAGAIVAAVAVWLIARYAIGLQLRTPGFAPGQHVAALPVGLVVAASAVASLAGWAAAVLIGRTARQPRRYWTLAGSVVLVLSLGAPFAGHGLTLGPRLALACMHIAVAAVLIPAFARTLPVRSEASRPARSAAPAVTMTGYRQGS